MRRDKNRNAVAIEVDEEVEDVVARLHVDAAGWFVEEEEPRISDKRPSEENSLLLSAGEVPDVFLPVFRDAEAFEQLQEIGFIGRSWPGPRSRGHRAAHQHRFFDRHREVPVDRLELRDVAERRTAARIDGLAIHSHATGIDPGDAQQGLQQRRLPRAARTDNADELALLDGERHVVDDCAAIIAGVSLGRGG